MKYLCLGYFDPERMDACPREQVEHAMRRCEPHLEELYGSGQVILDAGLGREIHSLRRVGDAVQVAEGPFAPGEARVGSAFLIEADDIDHAVRIAMLHPTTRLDEGEAWGWGIEIRPLHYFELDGC